MVPDKIGKRASSASFSSSPAKEEKLKEVMGSNVATGFDADAEQLKAARESNNAASMPRRQQQQQQEITKNDSKKEGTNAVNYHENDILSGGMSCHKSHPGNQRYSLIVGKHATSYQNAKKGGPIRKSILKQVLEEIQSNGARFMTNKNDTWVEMELIDVRNKIAESLRYVKVNQYHRATGGSPVKNFAQSANYHENDILFGGSMSHKSHPGNQRYSLIVGKHATNYQSAKKGGPIRKSILKQVLEEVQSNGARFMTNENDTWVEMELIDVRNKIADSLRHVKVNQYHRATGGSPVKNFAQSANYHENDILFGGSMSHKSHPGNQRYSLIVGKHITNYQSAKKGGPIRKSILKQVLEEVQANGARFMTNENDTWVEMELIDVRKRIADSLRYVKVNQFHRATGGSPVKHFAQSADAEFQAIKAQFLHQRVAKEFESEDIPKDQVKVFYGTVIGVTPANETLYRKDIFRIRYDDDDEEDIYLNEVKDCITLYEFEQKESEKALKGTAESVQQQQQDYDEEIAENDNDDKEEEGMKDENKGSDEIGFVVAKKVCGSTPSFVNDPRSSREDDSDPRSPKADNTTPRMPLPRVMRSHDVEPQKTLRRFIEDFKQRLQECAGVSGYQPKHPEAYSFDRYLDSCLNMPFVDDIIGGENAGVINQNGNLRTREDIVYLWNLLPAETFCAARLTAANHSYSSGSDAPNANKNSHSASTCEQSRDGGQSRSSTGKGLNGQGEKGLRADYFSTSSGPTTPTKVHGNIIENVQDMNEDYKETAADRDVKDGNSGGAIGLGGPAAKLQNPGIHLHSKDSFQQRKVGKLEVAASASSGGVARSLLGPQWAGGASAAGGGGGDSVGLLVRSPEMGLGNTGGNRFQVKMIDIREAANLTKRHKDGDKKSSQKRKANDGPTEKELVGNAAKMKRVETSTTAASTIVVKGSINASAPKVSEQQEESLLSAPSDPAAAAAPMTHPARNDLVGGTMSAARQPEWELLLKARSNKLSADDRLRVQQFFKDGFNPTPEHSQYKMKLHEARMVDLQTGKVTKKETYYLELDYQTLTSKQTKKAKFY